MTKDQALVSVVIPVWNTGESVAKLVKELFDQTYQNTEIIAVDDGSEDDSLKILQALEQEDSRLKVLHQKNAGASAARNKGIEVARGKYVIFIDSDDDVANDFVEKLVKPVEANPDVTLAVTGMRYNRLQEKSSENVYTEPRRKRRERELRADYLLMLLLCDGRMYSSVNKIFRLDVIKQSRLKFEVGRDFAEDTKFVLDYLRHAPGEIEFVNEPLYIYNFGTDTSTVRSSSTIWQNWNKSYADLKEWAKTVSGGKLHFRTRILLRLVRLRWRVSHYRAKKRAKRA